MSAAEGTVATSGPSKAELRKERKEMKKQPKEDKPQKPPKHAPPPEDKKADAEILKPSMKRVLSEAKQAKRVVPHPIGFQKVAIHIKDELADGESSVACKDTLGKLDPVFTAALDAVLSSGVCVARRVKVILDACKQFVAKYERPADKAFSWNLNETLGSQLDILHRFQPFTPGIQMAVNALRSGITKLNPDIADSDAKQSVIALITEFLSSRVDAAATKLSSYVGIKAADGKAVRVAVYGYSPLAISAITSQLSSELVVTVIDSRPHLEGQQTLQALQSAGVRCRYAQLSGASKAIQDVDVVLVEAVSVDACGNVLAAAGANTLAIMAQHWKKQVIVLSETFKVAERVFISVAPLSEMHPSDALVCKSSANPIEAWRLPTDTAAKTTAPSLDAAPIPWKDAGLSSADKFTDPLLAKKDGVRQFSVSYDIVSAANVTEYVTEHGKLTAARLYTVLAEHSR